MEKSSSYHSLTHLDELQRKTLSPRITAKSGGASSEEGRLSRQSPLSLHETSSSKSSSSRKKAHKSLSPLSNSTTQAPVTLQHNDRKRWLLERSLEPSPPCVATTTTPNLSHDVQKIRLNPGKSGHLSDDSLCSSHSSPTLLLSSVPHSSSPTPSTSSRNSSPHSSSSGSPEKEPRKQEARRERCSLDLYLLSPNTDFYQHMCTAWLDMKIVSSK